MLTARDRKILGRLDRSTFATAPDGRELRLKGPVMPYAVEQGPEAILVSKPVRAPDGRAQVDTYLATVQVPGTYARLAARKTYTPKDRPATPIDRDHELRRGLPRQAVQLINDDDSPEGTIRGALSRRPHLLVTDGRPPITSIAAVIAGLERAGVTLALSDDGAHLLVTSSEARTPERQAMNLRGRPVPGPPVRRADPLLLAASEG
jgi:hypothetical protein